MHLGESPADFREMTWRDGGASVHSFLDKLEERSRLFQQWSPRLRAFADKCHYDRPAPQETALGPRDRAKRQIFQSKLARPPVVGHQMMAICCMPLIAISVAQYLWGDYRQSIAILTPKEFSQWKETYTHPTDALEWSATFWWHIDDLAVRTSDACYPLTVFHLRDDDVVDGEDRWVLSVGESRGPFAGGGHGELWSWDGMQIKFIRTVGEWMS